MLKKAIWIIFAGLSILLSCTETTSAGKSKIKKIQHSGISREQMYDEDAVYDYVFDNQEFDHDSLKKKGRKHFLAGLDEFKNKKNPAKAIDLFKKSILQYPEAVTYYELGNALVADGRYTEALLAYTVAQKLEIEPTGILYYNLAIATYYSSDYEQQYPSEALDYFEKALEHGFTDWDYIKSDRLMAPLMQNPKYQEIYNEYHLSQGEIVQDTFRFHLFKKNFPYKETIAMSAEDVTFFSSEQYISYDYEDFVKEMRNASFSREVSEEFFYVAMLDQNEKYVVLLYASADAMSDHFIPTQFIMATYSRSGEEIDKREVGSSQSVSAVKAFKWEEGKLYIEEFVRTWKYDTSEKIAKENKIANLTSVKQSEYTITSEGRFSEINYNSASAKE